MSSKVLERVIVRDLDSVRLQVEAYERESDLWRLPKGIANSAGTLVLHLAGNLQHFIGAQLGGSGYVRERELEFSRRDVPRVELLRELDAAGAAVSSTLSSLKAADLEQPYPLEVGGVRLPTGLFLAHLASHLAYHLGQIDTHRRVVSGDSRAAGALSIAHLVG